MTRNAWDKINALINGESPDEMAVAFWRHFPIDDQNADRLANATIRFQNTFNMDIVKVSPSSSFCLRDWGLKDAWTGNTEGTRDYDLTSLLTIEDLPKFKVLEPRSGNLGVQLKALAKIIDTFSSNVPVIQTIFSPMSQLKNLLGKKKHIALLRNEPKTIKKGLDIICETTAKFMQECIAEGVDGFFFAIQHASADLLSLDEFFEFAKAYDERLFNLMESTRVNLAHIHGANIYFENILDYPVQIINWHDRDTFPSLKEAANFTDKVLCGGLQRIHTMVQGNTGQINQEIDDAIKQAEANRLILGTGCVLPIITPYGNIKQALNYARLH